MTIKKISNILFAGFSIIIIWASCTGGKESKQPVLGTMSVSIIEKKGFQFKDLNKNGELDPYEDWRLVAEERAEDLLSKMTLEEKAGLMHITSERRRGGGVPGGGVFPGRDAGAARTEANTDAVEVIPEDPFPSTVDYINSRHLRYLIIRDNIPASRLGNLTVSS